MRSLSDDEEILAAAFEARFHFDHGIGPLLMSGPPDMKPFEMPGRLGPTLWRTKQNPMKALSDCYATGVGLVSFEPWDRDEGKAWPKRLIRWNQDRTEAEVQISTRYGGLNGSGYDLKLHKFLGHWVVTSMERTWVS